MTIKKILAVAILAFFWASCAATSENGLGEGSVKRDEAKARAHLSLGTVHLKNGRLIHALKDLLEAEKYDPQNADVQNHLGVVYQNLKKYPLAVDHLKRALALRKNFRRPTTASGQSTRI